MLPALIFLVKRGKTNELQTGLWPVVLGGPFDRMISGTIRNMKIRARALFTSQRIAKNLTGRERSSDRVTLVQYNTRKRLRHFPSKKEIIHREMAFHKIILSFYKEVA